VLHFIRLTVPLEYSTESETRASEIALKRLVNLNEILKFLQINNAFLVIIRKPQITKSTNWSVFMIYF